MPMVRVLGSKNSMTFGDPTHVDYGLLGSLYLENFSLPFINLAGQLGGNGDASTVYVNAMTAGIAELAGRGLTAVVASHYKSYLGICLASPVAWIFASALLLVMYFGIMNKYKKAGNFRE